MNYCFKSTPVAILKKKKRSPKQNRLCIHFCQSSERQRGNRCGLFPGSCPETDFICPFPSIFPDSFRTDECIQTISMQRRGVLCAWNTYIIICKLCSYVRLSQPQKNLLGITHLSPAVSVSFLCFFPERPLASHCTVSWPPQTSWTEWCAEDEQHAQKQKNVLTSKFYNSFILTLQKNNWDFWMNRAYLSRI